MCVVCGSLKDKVNNLVSAEACSITSASCFNLAGLQVTVSTRAHCNQSRKSVLINETFSFLNKSVFPPITVT